MYVNKYFLSLRLLLCISLLHSLIPVYKGVIKVLHKIYHPPPTLSRRHDINKHIIHSDRKYFNPLSAGIDFRRQNLTSKVEPRTERVKKNMKTVDQ